MATIVCHHHHRGLQSCLESHTVEPRALRLTLSSSRPHFSPPSLELTSKSVSVNSSPEPGGWSVLQALFDGPRLSKEIDGNEITYAHPLAKRSLSTLSDKSLELCTENLGSETGSDDVLEDDNDVFSSLSSSTNRQNENRATWKQLEPRQVLGGTKATGGEFPPPLTTISGSESIRVRPHRENGRLVIKAEKAPYNNSIFRADRSNGRLRLCILKDSTPSIDYKEESTTDKENDNNNNHNEEEEEEEFENDGNTIAEKDELDKEETKFERREGRDGRGGGVGGGRCRGGEREEQRIYSGFACMI
ncbi:hypothetical protein V6N13_040827 [Hibiscus sabdariffa]